MLHGGDIYHNQVNMDFSVNVNPLGAPQSVLDRMEQAISRVGVYPEPTAERLRNQLAKYYGIAPEQILCGNGSSELFMALVHGLHPSQIIIPVPSFYGYQWAAGAVDAKVHLYPMQKEQGYQLDAGFLDYVRQVDAAVDSEKIVWNDAPVKEISHMGREGEFSKKRGGIVVFLANPNNPTGLYIDSGLLRDILDYTEENQIHVILDECFMELSDEPERHSLIPRISDYQYVWIVRAFTKTYAIPGIRLGYLIGHHEKKFSLIRRQLPEWNVSLPAQEAGIAALDEVGYLMDSRDYIQKEREYLERELLKIGQSFKESSLILYPSVTNYLLFYSSIPFYDSLLDQGILIRDCGSFAGLSDGYYRIAVRTHEENRELVEILQDNWEKWASRARRLQSWN